MKLNSLIFNSLIFLILTSVCLQVSAHAPEWKSKSEVKYQESSPELYAQLLEARKLIDSYRGQSQRIKKAGKILNRIIVNDISFAPAYREMGRYHILNRTTSLFTNKASNYWDLAEYVILKAIELDENYEEAYVLLGHVYKNQERYDEAEKVLEKGYALGSRSPWVYNNRGDVYFAQKKYQDAFKQYLEVIESETSNKKAYSAALDGLIRVHKKYRNYPAAHELYKIVLETEPESAWNWGNYADFLLYSMGDYEEAITTAEKALDIMNFGHARKTLSSALYTKWAHKLEQGEEDAQEYFDRANELRPVNTNLIEWFEKKKFTKITGKALRKWMERQDSTAT